MRLNELRKMLSDDGLDGELEVKVNVLDRLALDIKGVKYTTDLDGGDEAIIIDLE